MYESIEVTRQVVRAIRLGKSFLLPPCSAMQAIDSLLNTVL